EGQVITGDILVEKPTQLYVDIGITVLTIPKDKILEYEYTDTEQADPTSKKDTDGEADTGSGPTTSDPRKLYRTAELKKTDIEPGRLGVGILHKRPGISDHQFSRNRAGN
ncbi:MAG: hypothetical protein ACYSWQ_14455, partial [Planctomycetota bacterium]